MGMPTLRVISDASQEYIRLYDSMVEKYKCEWDDKVHDSFGLYKNKISDCVDRLAKVMKNAERIESKVKEIEDEGVVERCRDLCSEAESL